VNKTLLPGEEEEDGKVKGKKEGLSEGDPELRLQAFLNNIKRGKGNGDDSDDGEEGSEDAGQTDPFGNSLNTQGQILGLGTSTTDPDPNKSANADPNAATAGAAQAVNFELPNLEIFDSKQQVDAASMPVPQVNEEPVNYEVGIEAISQEVAVIQGLLGGGDAEQIRTLLLAGLTRDEILVRLGGNNYSQVLPITSETASGINPPLVASDLAVYSPEASIFSEQAAILATIGDTWVDPGVPQGIIDESNSRIEILNVPTEAVMPPPGDNEAQLGALDRKEIAEEADKVPEAPGEVIEIRTPDKTQSDFDDARNEPPTLLNSLGDLVKPWGIDSATERVLDPRRRMLLDDIRFGSHKHEKYTVYEGDTLNSIAKRKLKEVRLAKLIYNTGQNKKILGPHIDFKSTALKKGLVLELPNFAEIITYKSLYLHDHRSMHAQLEIGGPLPSADKSSKLSEPICYTCRINDTLLAIAKRYYQDAAIWKLIAQKNQLSIANGSATARLKRGDKITLPDGNEVEEFKSTLLTMESLTAHPNSGLLAIAHKTRRTVAGPGETQHETRMITKGDLGEGDASLLLKLEVSTKGQWLPIVEYSVGKPSSYLQIYEISGGKRFVPIELRTREARELAENDLAINAQQYCANFFAGVLPF
jgi:LysM repeat protein